MRVLKVVALVAVAVTVALGAAAFAALYFVVDVCGTFDDTGGPFPANDSPQGQVCGASRHESWLALLAGWSIPVAAALAIVLAVLAWRRGGTKARCAGALGLVVLPMLPLPFLGVPSDTCTPEVRRQPHSECWTST